MGELLKILPPFFQFLHFPLFHPILPQDAFKASPGSFALSACLSYASTSIPFSSYRPAVSLLCRQNRQGSRDGRVHFRRYTEAMVEADWGFLSSRMRKLLRLRRIRLMSQSMLPKPVLSRNSSPMKKTPSLLDKTWSAWSLEEHQRAETRRRQARSLKNLRPRNNLRLLTPSHRKRRNRRRNRRPQALLRRPKRRSPSQRKSLHQSRPSQSQAPRQRSEIVRRDVSRSTEC